MPSHKKFIRQEQEILRKLEEEESIAVNEVGLFSSFTQACVKSIIEPLSSSQWTSFTTKRDRKGNVIEKVPYTVRVQDVLKACKRFLAKHDYDNTRLIYLSEAEKLTNECFPWLQQDKEHYCHLSPLDEIELRKCIHKAFKDIILENKYLGWLRCPNKSDPDEDYWVNDDLRRTYEFSYQSRVLGMSDDARIVHKIIKDPEDKELAQGLIHNHHEERAKQLADPVEMEKALREMDAKKDEKRKQRRKGNDDTGEVAI
jgi:hypothetical protein